MFALRAGLSTFDLSRYMGASPTLIDRHYGHLDRYAVDVGGRSVDVEALVRSYALAGKPRE